jgi:mitochondrial fission protein ELM1
LVESYLMRVWTVSEVKAGTLTQCLGVAHHIDPEPHTVVVQKALKRWQTGLFSPYRKLEQPEPDVIISCGRMAPRHVFAIAAACKKPPFTVHLQTPQPEFTQRYNLAFVSRHDWTEEKSNIPTFRQMSGVPHQITKSLLQKTRPEARARWVKEQGRAIAVLIGGSNGAYAYDGETIARLIHAIRQLAAEGWTVLVSTSRRSEPTILRHLLELKDDRIVVWDRSGENPYRDFLAAADAFLVAKDSITMNCEAATSGRPVFSFDLARIESDKLQKFERFHDDMMNGLGLTRPFEGKIYEYPYEYTNESLRLANIVKEEIQQAR